MSQRLSNPPCHQHYNGKLCPARREESHNYSPLTEELPYRQPAINITLANCVLRVVRRAITTHLSPKNFLTGNSTPEVGGLLERNEAGFVTTSSEGVTTGSERKTTEG